MGFLKNFFDKRNTEGVEVTNEINELYDIKNKINEVILSIDEVEESIDYENFLNTNTYLKFNKVFSVFEDIKNSNSKNFLYNNLGEIFVEYEKNLNTLNNELLLKKLEIEEMLVKNKVLSDEIISFTKSVNKVKSEGAIVMKQKITQLRNIKDNLTYKRDDFIKKEDTLNKELEELYVLLTKNIDEFIELSAFILLYLDETEN